MMGWITANLWPLSYLTIAVVDDLVYKKFHNALFVALTVVGVGYVYFFSPLSWQDSLLGFVIGGGMLLPLVLIKALGAGDMKFMMAFGLLVGGNVTFSVIIYSLFWGALIGLTKALLGGHIRRFWSNLVGFIHKLKPAQTTKIPYTIAIFLGWLTFQQIGGVL